MILPPTRYRLLLVTLALACVNFLCAEASKQFQIPAGPASQTLKQFARQAELSIVFDPRSVRKTRTNALSGEHPPSLALQKLIAGTQLHFKQDPSTGAIAIQLRPERPSKHLKPKPSQKRKTSPHSQTAENAPSLEDEIKTIFTLSPFVTNAGTSPGYQATFSQSATGLDVPLQDIPFNLQVVTRSFIDDTLAYGGQPLPFGGGANREATSWIGSVEGKGVRGFNTREYLRNGFLRYADNGSSTIDRIEVIKGPTSVLDGVTSPGGVINVITKKPNPNYDFNHLTLVYGTPFHRIVTNFDSNKRLTETDTNGLKATLRLTGGYEASDYLTKHRKRRLENVMPSLLLEFSPRTSLGLQYEYYKVNGERGNDQEGFRRVVTVEHPSGLHGEVPLHYAYGLPLEMSWDGPQHSTPEIVNDFLATLQHQFSENVVFSLNYSKHERDSNWGPVTRISSVIEIDDQPYWQQSWRETNRAQTVEGVRAKLASKWNLQNSEHRFVFGFLRQNDFNDWRVQDYLDSNGDLILQRFPLLDPNPDLTPPTPSTYKLSPIKNDLALTQSLYANHHAKWLGGRLVTLWGIYDARLDSETIRTPRAPHHNVPPDVEYSTGKAMPQAGLTYSLTPDLSLYLNYSQSMQGNAGRFDGWGNSFSETPGEIREIGSKFSLADGKFSGTASLFEIVETNRVVFDWTAPNRDNPTADPNLPRGANVSFGELTSQGFDADLYFSPNENFNVVFSYGYKDARITADPRTERIGKNTNDHKHKITAFGKYTWNDGLLKGFATQAGLVWKSKRQRSRNRFGEPAYANAQYEIQAGFDYSFTYGELSYKLGFLAKNLFQLNQSYQGYIPGTRDSYYLDNPAEYLLSLRIEY